MHDAVADVDKTRGLALWKLGRRDEAREALSLALRLDADDRQAAAHLAALEAGAETPQL